LGSFLIDFIFRRMYVS